MKYQEMILATMLIAIAIILLPETTSGSYFNRVLASGLIAWVIVCVISMVKS